MKRGSKLPHFKVFLFPISQLATAEPQVICSTKRLARKRKPGPVSLIHNQPCLQPKRQVDSTGEWVYVHCLMRSFA